MAWKAPTVIIMMAAKAVIPTAKRLGRVVCTVLIGTPSLVVDWGMPTVGRRRCELFIWCGLLAGADEIPASYRFAAVRCGMVTARRGNGQAVDTPGVCGGDDFMRLPRWRASRPE